MLKKVALHHEVRRRQATPELLVWLTEHGRGTRPAWPRFDPDVPPETRAKKTDQSAGLTSRWEMNMLVAETIADPSPLLTRDEARLWLGVSASWLRRHETELGVIHLAGDARMARFPMFGLVERAVHAANG